MLTGEQSALVFVEDLRVGDVLEYSHTTRGIIRFSPAITPRGSAFNSVLRLIANACAWSGPEAKPLHAHAPDRSDAGKDHRQRHHRIPDPDFHGLTAIDFDDFLPRATNPIRMSNSATSGLARVVDWARCRSMPSRTIQSPTRTPAVDYAVADDRHVNEESAPGWRWNSSRMNCATPDWNSGQIHTGPPTIRDLPETLRRLQRQDAPALCDSAGDEFETRPHS